MARFTDAEVLERIADHLAETGHMPSVRQLRDSLGFASTSTVQHHLDRLVADGSLIRAETTGPGAYHRYRFPE
jgi:SOS-response transcriptional repressor LexA